MCVACVVLPGTSRGSPSRNPGPALNAPRRLKVNSLRCPVCVYVTVSVVKEQMLVRKGKLFH